MNGTPGVVNSAINAFGYFGSGRTNPIRRKNQITFAAAYSKPDTATDSTLLGIDEFGGISIQHSSGSPGSAKFNYYSGSTKTESGTLTGSGPHVVIGTFNGTTMKVYADGTASTGQSANSTYLWGAYGGTYGETRAVLVTGSQNSKYIDGSGNIFEDSQGKASVADLIVFDKGLSATEAAALDTLLATRVAR